MVKASEFLAVAGAGASIVAISITATLYVADNPSGNFANLTQEQVASGGRRAFDISDAFFPCRDYIDTAIPYKVRNINVDSRSSRYDDSDNAHVVFIDLEVMERPGAFYSKYSYDAHIVCRVSAANNEITSFRVRKG